MLHPFKYTVLPGPRVKIRTLPYGSKFLQHKIFSIFVIILPLQKYFLWKLNFLVSTWDERHEEPFTIISSVIWFNHLRLVHCPKKCQPLPLVEQTRRFWNVWSNLKTKREWRKAELSYLFQRVLPCRSG